MIKISFEKWLRDISRTFIENQTDQWLIQFYISILDGNYLSNTKILFLLKTKPILRLDTNEVVSFYNRVGNIQAYLPSNNDLEYPTIKNCFIQNKKSLKFLKGLGLTPPQQYDEIQYYILPKYKTEQNISEADIFNDFEKILQYFLTLSSAQQKFSYLQQLQKFPFCYSGKLLLPSQIYCNSLSHYFENYSNVYFLNDNFYSAFFNLYGKNILNNFFKSLGVADLPRRIKIKADLSVEERQEIHQGCCSYDYCHLIEFSYDYDLEGLNNFLAVMNFDKSKLLWQLLLKKIVAAKGKEIFKGQYHWVYRGNKYYYFDAQFLLTLRDTTWLYNKDLQCFKPNEIQLADLNSAYDTSSYAAKILVEKLQIASAKSSKLAQLEKQFTEKIQKQSQIETLQSRIAVTEKYSVAWFNDLLSLENLLDNSFMWESLKYAFQEINSEDNLQKTFLNDIELIYGPPGTGKTTFLVKEKIIPLAEKNKKILVLTPTNKAADLLVKKTIEFASKKISQKLIRVGISSDDEIEAVKTNKYDFSKSSILVTTIAKFLYDRSLNYHWDVVIFDEASMIMLAQIIYVLYKPSKFIIAGDPFQIPPVVLAKEWQDENIYSFLRLKKFKSNKTSLMRQYRSLPAIGSLFSQFSYGGLISHHRQATSQKPLRFNGINLSEISVIKFPIKKKHQLYKPHSLNQNSTYHIYSALLCLELSLYLVAECKKQKAEWKIGIICPYLAQANLIEKMINAQYDINENQNITILVGTIHKFQGDEFDIILSVLNPPKTISKNIILNKQHILNVAISRAKDYLILLIPDIDGIEQIKRLEITLQNSQIKPHCQQFKAAEIEQILFQQSNYIEENTEILAHRSINVYTQTNKKYIVSLDQKVVDVWISS
jgi:superfamily I DNA and/or RNA helicase